MEGIFSMEKWRSIAAGMSCLSMLFATGAVTVSASDEITEINKVLFEGKSAAEAVIDLMVRDKKVETPMLPWEDGQKTN